MPPNSYSQDNTPYGNGTPGGYEKTSLKKLLLIAVGIIATIVVIALVIHASQPDSQQSQYIKNALAAARKKTPNAKVANVRVANGFAMALVSDPTADGQARSGNITVFKVNPDGSMEQLATGSDFSTIYLLELGIPLSTQGTLTQRSTAEIKQNLANECGYNGGSIPGYSGFGGSFNPGGWQIDATTLDGLEQVLLNVISNQNSTTSPDKAVICVNATQQNSNTTTDPKTYDSTFTLRVEFIASDGTLTAHTLTFTIGSYHHLSYTLDGHDIK